MIIINREDVEYLLTQGNEDITFKITLDFLEKLQLYLTGRITKKVELFGIRPIELFRGLAFMVGYSDLINYAVQNNYRVFVFKEGGYFQRGDWYLEFEINN